MNAERKPEEVIRIFVPVFSKLTLAFQKDLEVVLAALNLTLLDNCPIFPLYF